MDCEFLEIGKQRAVHQVVSEGQICAQHWLIDDEVGGVIAHFVEQVYKVLQIRVVSEKLLQLVIRRAG